MATALSKHVYAIDTTVIFCNITYVYIYIHYNYIHIYIYIHTSYI